LLTIAEATPSIRLSEGLQPKVFHEFQPMGGVAASTLETEASPPPASVGTAASLRASVAAWSVVASSAPEPSGFPEVASGPGPPPESVVASILEPASAPDEPPEPPEEDPLLEPELEPLPEPELEPLPEPELEPLLEPFPVPELEPELEPLPEPELDDPPDELVDPPLDPPDELLDPDASIPWLSSEDPQATVSCPTARTPSASPHMRRNDRFE
jgi:hypothetical protein